VAKKQTFTLDFVPDFDFEILAIYCAYRDYKLCAELNKILNYSLEKKTDLELNMGKKGSSGRFPYFLFINEDEEEIYLISNKVQQHVFIPELKQVDYFFVIKNKSKLTDVDEILTKLLNIQIISSAQEVFPDDLKSADHFLLLEPIIETDDDLKKLPPVK